MNAVGRNVGEQTERLQRNVVVGVGQTLRQRLKQLFEIGHEQASTVFAHARAQRLERTYTLRGDRVSARAGGGNVRQTQNGRAGEEVR